MQKITDRIDPYTARDGYAFNLAGRSQEQLQQIINKLKRRGLTLKLLKEQGLVVHT